MAPERKIALVTGGARGIGRAIAARLLDDGWAVLLTDRDGGALRRAAEALADQGPVTPHVCDVSREEDVRRVAEAAADGGRLDALVNNAGFGVWKPIDALSLDEWNQVIGTNLTGAFLCAKSLAPLLRQSGGAIVNIASTRALMSEPNGESYGASKGGLVALTHALAISLGPEVRANCVSPGWIDVSDGEDDLSDADHAQHPVGRVGRPEDVAAMVTYLLSPAAAFVTGANITVDGGMTRKMVYV